MFSQDDDSHGWILGVVFGIVALVIALAIGLGIHQTNLKAKATAVAAAPVTATAPSADATDAASVKVDNGVVKFYFASGKSDVATGGNEALVDVVKAVAAGKKAVISGFHDATGDLAKNEELSKLRAFAVRDALKALGVAEDKIELKKPENMLAGGSNAEARRVEVAIK
jgi:outer membrane protein OmpA-like peptidoglycan-associated protein